MNRIKRLFVNILTGRFDSVWYALWTRLRGLDLGVVSLQELGLSPDRSKGHSNTGGPDLVRVFKSIEIPPGSRVVDLGSGKGGAIFSLSRFPFAEIVGVEISEELVRIANANTARLGLKNTSFYCSDASEFRDFDRFTHVYMANAFPLEVMRAVMDNLIASLDRKPRPLTLIFESPFSLENVINSELFRLEKEFRFRYRQPFFVYVHEVPRKV